MNTLRIRRILLAGAALALLAAGAEAANPDTVTLTVAIGNQLSVRLRDAGGADLSAYDFGPMSLGQASVNSSPINVDNDSGGLTESLQLSVGDTGGGLILRTTTGALAQDEYRLQGLFQDAQPAHGDFGSEDILTTSPQAAQAQGAGAVFATASTGGAEDGVNISDNNRLGTPPTAEVRLWLRLELAGSSTLSGTQTNFATVYVNAY